MSGYRRVCKDILTNSAAPDSREIRQNLENDPHLPRQVAERPAYPAITDRAVDRMPFRVFNSALPNEWRVSL